VEELPQYYSKKIVYTKQNPAFVVAWIQDHLAEKLKEKETFLTDFVGEIVPDNFKVDYDAEKHIVNIKL
jgi:hypothetical protein